MVYIYIYIYLIPWQVFNETIWTLRNRKPCSKERRGKWSTYFGVIFIGRVLNTLAANHCLRMFELNRTRPKPSSAAKWHCGGPINEPKSIDTGHKILKCWYMKYICLVVRSLLLYLFKKSDNFHLQELSDEFQTSTDELPWKMEGH